MIPSAVDKNTWKLGGNTYASRGVGPYTYSTDGNSYQVSNIFLNIPAGTYVGYVKDSKGCIGFLPGIFVGPNGCSPTFTKNYNLAKVDQAESSLKVQVYPNPSSTAFTLALTGNNTDKVTIIVTDIIGRKAFEATGPGNKPYKFGNDFIRGVYIVQVIQGRNKQNIKLVKQ